MCAACVRVHTCVRNVVKHERTDSQTSSRVLRQSICECVWVCVVPQCSLHALAVTKLIKYTFVSAPKRAAGLLVGHYDDQPLTAQHVQVVDLDLGLVGFAKSSLPEPPPPPRFIVSISKCHLTSTPAPFVRVIVPTPYRKRAHTI